MNHPNIVFIICHDLGQHLGCYGVPTVHTPHLDALAANSVRWGNSYCVSPSCSASRSAIFTGRYPHSNGMLGLTHGIHGWDLHPHERHLAAILRDQGYRTAAIGQIHESHRTDLGFDTGQHENLVCEVVAERAEKLLAEQRGADRPFYLQVGFFEPHRPFNFGDASPDDSRGVTVPPFLQDEPSAREELAEFQGIIRKMDAAAGRVLAAVDANGLAENSIVVFTADHGIPFPRAKCTLYDPGLQVPLIIRWPRGGLVGGAVRDNLVSNVDYLPTLLELAGLPVPGTVQGQSFLRPGRDAVFAELTYHSWFNPMRAIRTATHKLIVNFAAGEPIQDPSQAWRPLTTPVASPLGARPLVEFYDLTADPNELVNLPATKQRQELLERLCRWMEDTDDPLLHGVPVSPMHKQAWRLLRGNEA